MRESHFDIGLAPLNTDDFSKCKYFNKFIEYTTQGITGVYSETEPYTYVVRDGENGFLAGNDPEKWYETICRAVTDKKLRQKCLEGAIAYLRENHSEEAVVDKYFENIPEAAKENGSYDKCADFSAGKTIYKITKPIDWIYLSFYYLKRTGIKGVVDKIKAHFAEAKA